VSILVFSVWKFGHQFICPPLGGHALVPVEDMEEVPTDDMVVVTATFSLHDLDDPAVVISFYVKCDKKFVKLCKTM
jgi:hypothetical protein